MKKTLLTIMVFGTVLGLFFTPSEAEALKVKLEPSITFRQSNRRSYHRPKRVVRQYQDVHYYHDPYTHYDNYYYYPVTREYVEYYPSYRNRSYSRGTDFKLKFKFK